jgi:signal peptidase I
VTRRPAALLLVVLVAAGWALWLRPQALGGRSAFIIVRGDSMRPTLSAGDLVIVRREPKYHIGQVVTYRIPDGRQKGARVIHRIVGGTGEEGFLVRGDNKGDADLWRPRTRDVVGRAWLRLPWVGRLLLWLRAPAVLAAVAGGFAFSLAMTWPSRRGRGDPPGEGTGPSPHGGHPDHRLVEAETPHGA